VFLLVEIFFSYVNSKRKGQGNGKKADIYLFLFIYMCVRNEFLFSVLKLKNEEAKYEDVLIIYSIYR